MTGFELFFGGAVALRLLTLAVSIRNERALKSAGATEYGKGVSTLLALAHTAFYLAALSEYELERNNDWQVTLAGLVVYGFGMASLIYVWSALGRFWTVKLIIARDHLLISSGPYRVMKHPNYFLNILPELVGLCLVLGAFVTLIVGIPLYSILLFMRIRLENRLMLGYYRG
jgi:isoprenylcysteine carboxyl methyltransferase (ICMT) family protein YpbQ